MTRENTQAKVLSAIADIIEATDMTTAEKVGVLAVLQTSYILAATKNK